jgi:hypothetical protein
VHRTYCIRHDDRLESAGLILRQGRCRRFREYLAAGEDISQSGLLNIRDVGGRSKCQNSSHRRSGGIGVKIRTGVHE